MHIYTFLFALLPTLDPRFRSRKKEILVLVLDPGYDPDLADESDPAYG
jgi:hypothetical protein